MLADLRLRAVEYLTWIRNALRQRRQGRVSDL